MSDCTPARIIGTYEAHPSLIDRERRELERQGVPAEAIERLRAGYVVRTGPDAFELDQHTTYGKPERAFLFLVRDVCGDPADIVAWQPATDWLGIWRGLAWALGQEVVYAGRLTEHGALKVHQNPLAWLRDVCRGIVLTRARIAAAFLNDAGPLLADDVKHGSELKRALTRPAPRIVVPQRAGAI
jgi:hypothetical protein